MKIYHIFQKLSWFNLFNLSRSFFQLYSMLSLNHSQISEFQSPCDIILFPKAWFSSCLYSIALFLVSRYGRQRWGLPVRCGWSWSSWAVSVSLFSPLSGDFNCNDASVKTHTHLCNYPTACSQDICRKLDQTSHTVHVHQLPLLLCSRWES